MEKRTFFLPLLITGLLFVLVSRLFLKIMANGHHDLTTNGQPRSSSNIAGRGSRLGNNSRQPGRTSTLKDINRNNRSKLIAVLSGRLQPILEMLLLQQVISLGESEQIRRKQRRPQRATSLIDIVLRKPEELQSKFVDIVLTKYPETRGLLGLSDDETIHQCSNFGLDMDLSDSMEACNVIRAQLRNRNYGPYRFYQILKAIQQKGITISTLVFDDGFNILHEIVKADRPDVLKCVSYVGSWKSLFNKPSDGTTGPHAGLTPLQLATTMMKTKMRDVMNKINESEISENLIVSHVRNGDVRGFLNLKDKYARQLNGHGPESNNSLLDYACQSGSLLMLQEVIKMEKMLYLGRGTSIDKLLALCIDIGQHQLIGPLMNYMPVDLNKVVVEGKLLVEHAAFNGDIQTLQKLMELGARVQDSIVAVAAAQHRLPFIEEIFKIMPESVENFLRFKDKRGKTAAHFAAEKGFIEIVKILLKKGYDLKTQDKRGYTILHAVAGAGSVPTMELILEESKRVGLLQWLLNRRDVYLGNERCFLVRGRDNDHEAWHYVEAHRHLIDIFQRKTAGGSLDVAMYGRVLKSGWGANPAAEVLRQVEADYDAQNTKPGAPADMQALHLAIIKMKEDLALRLIDIMDDVGQPDSFGMTPLHLAAMRGNVKIVNALLQKGSCQRVKDLEGRTPETIAEQNEHVQVATILKNRSRFSTEMIRRAIMEAHTKLLDEEVEKHAEDETGATRYIKQILRNLTADINEYMYDFLGEGPIASETGSVS